MEKQRLGPGAENKAGLLPIAKQNSGTTNEIQKAHGGIKRNKEIQQSIHQRTSNNTPIREGWEQGGGARRQRRKKRRRRERQKKTTPRRLSLRDVRTDPDPGEETGGGVGVRDVTEEEHDEESK